MSTAKGSFTLLINALTAIFDGLFIFYILGGLFMLSNIKWFTCKTGQFVRQT